MMVCVSQKKILCHMVTAGVGCFVLGVRYLYIYRTGSLKVDILVSSWREVVLYLPWYLC